MQPVFFCAKIYQKLVACSVNESRLFQSAANLRANHRANYHLNQITDDERQNTCCQRLIKRHAGLISQPVPNR